MKIVEIEGRRYLQFMDDMNEVYVPCMTREEVELDAEFLNAKAKGATAQTKEEYVTACDRLRHIIDSRSDSWWKIKENTDYVQELETIIGA